MKSFLKYLVLLLVIFSGFYVFWHKKPEKIHLKSVSFAHLPGWRDANQLESLQAFKGSCKVFLKQPIDRSVGSQFIPLKVGDWIPACKAALLLKHASKEEARNFFQKWFSPVAFYQDSPVEGLFTGYYMPILAGSLVKTAEFTIPLYGLPDNLLLIDAEAFDSRLKNRKFIGRKIGNRVIPYYARKDIVDGAVEEHAPVIAWIASPIDRLFLEIQGSGIISLKNGKTLYVGYAGQNGAPYTAVAGVLIRKGVMTKDNASMQAIRKYLEANPQEMDNVINENKSFVFFKNQKIKGAIGSQGIALTPKYSMAVDLSWIPIGTPIWLSTSHPDENNSDELDLKRLMIAQDTGGAIKGPVRGDVYWGEGGKAEAIAGRMKNKGYYWLLLPKKHINKTKQ